MGAAIASGNNKSEANSMISRTLQLNLFSDKLELLGQISKNLIEVVLISILTNQRKQVIRSDRREVYLIFQHFPDGGQRSL